VAGTTELEPPASAETALRELVLQQLRTTRGPPNIAQAVQDAMNCVAGNLPFHATKAISPFPEFGLLVVWVDNFWFARSTPDGRQVPDGSLLLPTRAF